MQLRGCITPRKAKPSTAGEVDDLCDLIQTQAAVTPPKKTKNKSTSSSKKVRAASAKKVRIVDGDDNVKENLVKAPRFSTTPIRRSPRRN